MTDVAVVHMDLGAKGGGEAVAMNVIEALQDDYDLTLLTLTDPDLGELNDYFDTGVDPSAVSVRRAGRLAPAINERFGLKYYVLQNALLGRYARRHADEFDLTVSTINELGLGPDAVQYVHFPFDWTVSLDDREKIFHPTVESDSPYERLCTLVAGVSREDVAANAVFANSGWTADAFEEAYGVRPEVLHPPVDTREFVDRPWSERENGFVAVGRIERSKRVVEMIEVVDAVRERGHDVHLHVVGPTVDGAYRREVDELAADREHVEVDGELSRDELVDRLCTHRYGLHGKEHEHFGMAVAEMAAAGALPFVPAAGGQCAVVRDREPLLYDSPADAVEKIDRVLSDPALQGRLRSTPAEVERRFGRERFGAAIREAVADALGRPGSATTRPVARASRSSSSGD